MYHMSNEAERSETYMTYRTIETDSPVNWTVIRRPNNRNEVLSSKLDSTGVTNKTNGIYGPASGPICVICVVGVPDVVKKGFCKI